MSAHRRSRSQFDGQSDKARIQIRERAKTIAEQTLDRPESIRDMPDRGEAPHSPAGKGGTYNGQGTGSTGVHLMAEVIANRATIKAPAAARRSVTAQPWLPKPASKARAAQTT